MSTQSHNLSTELQEQISAFQQQMLPKIPKEILETFEKTTTELVRSGIAERSLHVGEKAPDFTLANTRGERVIFSEVLKKRTCGRDLLPWRLVTVLQPAVAGVSKAVAGNASAGSFDCRDCSRTT